jgi:CubicO group peptidase (beta-lactamase class C family)
MADSVSPRIKPERLQTAFDRLREAVEAGELPVGLLAVANREGTLRCEAHGPDGPIGTDGIFWIASITKPIVATAVMQMVEQGKLLLEDPVVRYLPEFQVNGKEGVKVWHLLTHTSGMADDYWHDPNIERSARADLEGAMQTHLRFPPGSRFEYCNVSYRILGEILERLSGIGYQEYLRQEVLLPAGMVDTSFQPEPAKRTRLLPVQDFPGAAGGMEEFMSLAMPGGGLFSTAADLSAFGRVFLNGGAGEFGRVLGPAALRVMTAVHTEGIRRHDNGEPEHWGLGWEKALPREGRLVSPSGYGHGGMSGTYLWVDPEYDLVVVFLTNRVGLDGRVRKGIVNAVLAAVDG